MQLKITKRTVDGILAFGCSGRIVFGEESGAAARRSEESDRRRCKTNCAEPGRSQLHRFGRVGNAGGAAYDRAQRRWNIKLANLTKRVGDLLQVTKLLTVFEVHDSEYEALEAFRTGGVTSDPRSGRPDPRVRARPFGR